VARYIKATKTSAWWAGGENASAECLPPDSDHCGFEVGYAPLRTIQHLAEQHAIDTGHVVQVERAQFRTVQRADR
jgi:hypothetical protein